MTKTDRPLDWNSLDLIYLGAACSWAWVRSWRWRAAHLAAIVYVALESLLGIACPLTIWEDALRGRQPGTGWIERWAISRPSPDTQARDLAIGERDAFAAWSVEDRSENQLLMCDFYGCTRS